MYQTIVFPCLKYFAISLSIYQSSKSFTKLDESINLNGSIKTIFIDYISFTANIYLLYFFSNLTLIDLID